MQLDQIKRTHKLKKSKRIGRGGKKGTYSGRGIKGQKSRAGRRFKPAIRELIKRYPKLKGYRRKSTAKNAKLNIVTVNLENLEKRFGPDEKVTPEILLEKKLIRKIKGQMPKVKILGQGKLTKFLTIEGCLISKKAKETIEKLHGVAK